MGWPLPLLEQGFPFHSIPKMGATFLLLGTETCSTDMQCREPAKLSQPFLLPMPDLSGA